MKSQYHSTDEPVSPEVKLSSWWLGGDFYPECIGFSLKHLDLGSETVAGLGDQIQQDAGRVVAELVT